MEISQTFTGEGTHETFGILTALLRCVSSFAPAASGGGDQSQGDNEKTWKLGVFLLYRLQPADIKHVGVGCAAGANREKHVVFEGEWPTT